MKTNKPTAHFRQVQQGCNRQATVRVPLMSKKNGGEIHCQTNDMKWIC
jgi:hypothetical protein